MRIHVRIIIDDNSCIHCESLCQSSTNVALHYHSVGKNIRRIANCTFAEENVHGNAHSEIAVCLNCDYPDELRPEPLKSRGNCPVSSRKLRKLHSRSISRAELIQNINYDDYLRGVHKSVSAQPVVDSFRNFANKSYYRRAATDAAKQPRNLTLDFYRI